jgi:hypothetical protein
MRERIGLTVITPDKHKAFVVANVFYSTVEHFIFPSFQILNSL